MGSTILYDQSNTALRMGTGIATYMRNLVTAAQQAGYSSDVLLSTDRALDRKNPILAEVALFDGAPDTTWAWLQDAVDSVRGAIHGPFGFRSTELRQAGVVMQPAGGNAASRFGRTYVAPRLFQEANAAFSVHGRLARVRVPETPAMFHASHPLALRVPGCPNIVTIHDLVPLRLPYATLDNKRFFYKLISRLVAQADHIVTVSEYSRRDIIDLFGVPEERITNTYQAVTLPPSVLARDEADIAREITNLFELEPGGYYLFVGALEPKKNVARLIDAYAASGSTRPLVIAGGAGWQNKRELESIADPRFANWRIENNVISSFKRIRRISYLPSEQLFTLMRGARALLFPSLFEGFGLPVLEAMTLGTPVLTSNTTSLPEIAGGAALMVDPHSTSAMATAIRALDNDADLLASLSARGRIQAAGFGMEAYTARIGALYKRILGGG